VSVFDYLSFPFITSDISEVILVFPFQYDIIFPQLTILKLYLVASIHYIKLEMFWLLYTH